MQPHPSAAALAVLCRTCTTQCSTSSGSHEAIAGLPLNHRIGEHRATRSSEAGYISSAPRQRKRVVVAETNRPQSRNASLPGSHERRCHSRQHDLAHHCPLWLHRRRTGIALPQVEGTDTQECQLSKRVARINVGRFRSQLVPPGRVLHRTTSPAAGWLERAISRSASDGHSDASSSRTLTRTPRRHQIQLGTQSLPHSLSMARLAPESPAAT